MTVSRESLNAVKHGVKTDFSLKMVWDVLGSEGLYIFYSY
jgi:hypothetical protein